MAAACPARAAIQKAREGLTVHHRQAPNSPAAAFSAATARAANAAASCICRAVCH
jgi:hypothetical protein